MWDAIRSETQASVAIEAASYHVNAIIASFHSTKDYATTCRHEDLQHKGGYFGMSLHPFDTIFIKGNREGTLELELYTQWYDSMNYTSRDYCGSTK